MGIGNEDESTPSSDYLQILGKELALETLRVGFGQGGEERAIEVVRRALVNLEQLFRYQNRTNVGDCEWIEEEARKRKARVPGGPDGK